MIDTPPDAVGRRLLLATLPAGEPGECLRLRALLQCISGVELAEVDDAATLAGLFPAASPVGHALRDYLVANSLPLPHLVVMFESVATIAVLSAVLQHGCFRLLCRCQ